MAKGGAETAVGVANAAHGKAGGDQLGQPVLDLDRPKLLHLDRPKVGQDLIVDEPLVSFELLWSDRFWRDVPEPTFEVDRNRHACRIHMYACIEGGEAPAKFGSCFGARSADGGISDAPLAVGPAREIIFQLPRLLAALGDRAVSHRHPSP